MCVVSSVAGIRFRGTTSSQECPKRRVYQSRVRTSRVRTPGFFEEISIDCGTQPCASHATIMRLLIRVRQWLQDVECGQLRAAVKRQSPSGGDGDAHK